MLNELEIRNKPFITVIIPVFNDIEGISTTLNSLLNQTYPKELYEILVVDNNSSDETLKIIQEFEKKYPKNIVGLSENEIQSSYAARNKAIKQSKGEVLVFIDSDMWVNKEWLKNIDLIFRDKESKYVGFNVINILKKRTLASFYDKIAGFPIQYYMQKYHFAGAGCIAVSRKIFEEIGLFNQQMISGGDHEFGNRVFQNGYSFIYKKEIKMYHPARDSLISLMKKWYRIGRGTFQMEYFHSKSDYHPKNILLYLFYLFIPPSFKDQYEIVKSNQQFSIMAYLFSYIISYLKNFIIRLGYLSEKMKFH